MFVEITIFMKSILYAGVDQRYLGPEAGVVCGAISVFENEFRTRNYWYYLNSINYFFFDLFELGA